MLAHYLAHREAISDTGLDADSTLLATAELMLARWKRARRLRAQVEHGAPTHPGPVTRLPGSLVRTLAEVADREARLAIADFLWQALDETADQALFRRERDRASEDALRVELSADKATAFVLGPDDEAQAGPLAVVGPRASDFFEPLDPKLAAATAMVEPWERAGALRDEWNRRAFHDVPMNSEERFELIAAIDEAASETHEALGHFLDAMEEDALDDEDDERVPESILSAFAKLVRPDDPSGAGGAASPRPSPGTS